VFNTACEQANPSRRLFEIYQSGKYLSIKHDSYFQVYEELFGKYVGKEITFVEVGVLNGGSLFMWREYFGPQARIIGIDLNPAAKKWAQEGFEIYIGSQSDPAFWDRLFAEIGPVDVVLDDGGHTNAQQIITSDKCIPHIKDGGMMVVEDVHTSYFKEFGNPSRWSFINYTKRLIDAVNSRFPAVNAVKSTYGDKVYSLSFFESIVCMHIDRKKCYISSPVTNNGISENAKDFRYKGTLQEFLFRVKRVFNQIPLARYLTNPVLSFLIYAVSRTESLKFKKYFN
jgi:hypothetical protein